MGMVVSRAYRQIQRFNVENRAMRAIERKSPVSAPRHKSSKELYEQIIKETPEVKAELQKKHKKLDDHLKGVFITSKDMTPEVRRDKSLLPQEKRHMGDDEYGFKMPAREDIPEGYVHLEDALKFITDHTADPKLWTSSAISSQYKLGEKNVVDVLQHYRTFNIHIPQVAEDKGGMYSIRRIKSDAIKNLLPGEKDDFQYIEKMKKETEEAVKKAKEEYLKRKDSET